MPLDLLLFILLIQIVLDHILEPILIAVTEEATPLWNSQRKAIDFVGHRFQKLFLDLSPKLFDIAVGDLRVADRLLCV